MVLHSKAKSDLDTQLRLAIEELNNTKTLWGQLLEECEDSELEIRAMEKKHTALKNEIAELHI